RHSWTIPGEFRWADGEDVDNLNPLLSTQTVVEDLSAFTMGYFFTFGKNNVPVPDLCLAVPTKENHLISSDGRALTFKLRHGVKWQDGAPFTSADVAFTVALIQDPKTNIATRDGWDKIIKVDTPDAYTVVFHLSQPYAVFMDKFFTPIGEPAILPKHLLEGRDVNKAQFNQLPVGTGPFKYVKWARNSEVVMEANPLFWGGKPKLKRVVFKVIPDSNTAASELRTHEIDAFVRVPSSMWLEVKNAPDTATNAHDTTSYGHVDFNLRNKALADVRVRQALAYAIDKKTLWEKVDHQSGYLSGSLVTHLSDMYDPGAPQYAFDLEKSKTLLEAAGWKMGPDGLRHKGSETLRFTFVGNVGNPGLDARVVLIQSWWKQIGVAIDYRRYQTNQLFANYAAGGIVATRKYDVASYAWSVAPEPDPTNLVACSKISPAGQNYMAYCNKRVDALLADATINYSRERRRKDLIEVQELLGADEPFVVLSQRTDHITYNDDLHGLDPGPSMIFWNAQSLSI
ncbi:MAG: peptide ABC transporter substrate-binding protein, partial [Candidatus Eremiobacteraeota bacterium]|nr:peptide ABC transporter substrate-binding protein [Candidatus Eremiobacteraeota bacterium]